MASSGSVVPQSKEKIDLSVHDKAVFNRIFNPSLPYNDVADESLEQTTEQEIETDAVKKAKELEVDGVKAAEAGDVDKALNFFNQAVEAAPERASGYNNRAQARQLKMDLDGAMSDLDEAIKLSGGKGKAACQAFTQRGILKRVKVNDDEARKDFEAAAALGSEFAKQQAIALNPIAALCNSMMCEMIQKAKSGQQ